MSLYEYRATVVNVVDGDTIDLDVALGFHVTSRERVRLNGINTPENHTLEGKAATVYVRELLPIGSQVRIETSKDKREKFGRYLAMVFLGDVNVNDLLIQDGHAVPYGRGTR
jgi:micrococcal nuclease